MAKERKLNPWKGTALVLLISGFFCTVSLAAEERDPVEEKAYLGVSVRALQRHEREDLGLKWGVRVIVVERKSAADQAGVEEDDILLTLDGEKVRRSFDLMEIVGEHEPGDQVNLQLLRDKQKMSLKVTLGKRSGREICRFKRPFLGVFLEEIDGDFAEYFAVKEKTAVLIRSLDPEGPAAKGGLKAGDVLLQVAASRIEKVGDVHRALEQLKAGDKVEITLLRHGKSLKLNLVLGEREEPRGLWFFRGGDKHPFEMMEPKVPRG